MKLKNILVAATAVLLLCSCSGQGDGESSGAGNGNTINLSLETSNDTFKGFKAVDSYAYLGGWSYNAKFFRRSLTILIGNYDGVKARGGIISMPPEGKAVIGINLYGNPSTDKKILTPLAVGKVNNFFSSGSDPAIAVSVASFNWKDSTLSGAKYLVTKELKGALELTELTDSRAKGTFVYTEGDSTLHVDFDVAIEDDWSL